MRVRTRTIVDITKDTAGKKVGFRRDDEVDEEIDDTFLRSTCGDFSVGVSASEVLSFGDVGDVRAIYIEADRDFSIKVNGGSESTLIRKPAGSTQAIHRSDSDLTSIEITNPDATNILAGSYAVWGDPTP